MSNENGKCLNMVKNVLVWCINNEFNLHNKPGVKYYNSDIEIVMQ